MSRSMSYFSAWLLLAVCLLPLSAEASAEHGTGLSSFKTYSKSRHPSTLKSDGRPSKHKSGSKSLLGKTRRLLSGVARYTTLPLLAAITVPHLLDVTTVSHLLDKSVTMPEFCPSLGMVVKVGASGVATAVVSTVQPPARRLLERGRAKAYRKQLSEMRDKQTITQNAFTILKNASKKCMILTKGSQLSSLESAVFIAATGLGAVAGATLAGQINIADFVPQAVVPGLTGVFGAIGGVLALSSVFGSSHANKDASFSVLELVKDTHRTTAIQNSKLISVTGTEVTRIIDHVSSSNKQ